MPASLPGQVPYSAVGSPTDYAVAQNAALRKRRLAEMLDQQSFKPSEVGLNVPGARMSWASALAPLLQGLAAKKMSDDADKSDAAAAKAQQDAFSDLLNNVPQGTAAQPAVPGTPDTPAQPATPGAFGPTPDNNSALSAMLMQGPGAAPKLGDLGAPPPAPSVSPLITPQSGGTDAIPGLPGTPAVAAKPPTPQEMLAYGGKFAALGPAAAKIGDQITQGAVTNLLPKSPRDRYLPLANGDTLDLQDLDASGKPKFLPAGPETQAKMALATKAQADKVAEQGAERERRAQKDQEDRESRESFQQQMLQSRYDLARAVGAVGGAGKTTDVGVDSVNGMPVVRGGDGRRYTMDSATGKATPYTGEVIPQTAHEKNVKDYMAADNEARINDNVAKAMKDPAAADAFDTWKRAAMGLGLSPQQAGVSDAGQRMLALQGRDFAETTKRLYGSSFTDSEQRRAGGFTITNKDDAASAAIKAENAALFAREMAQKYGGAAAAAASRRMSGGGVAPTAPASGGSNVRSAADKILGGS